MKRVFTYLFVLCWGCAMAQNSNRDSLQVVVLANSSKIMQGQRYSADIKLVRNVSIPYKVYINGQELEQEGNITRYKAQADGIGEYVVNGQVKAKINNVTMTFPFESYYSVYKSSAVVSADKMNILYIGIDNPVSIAVPGVLPDNIVASISNGAIRKVGDRYIVNVATKGETQISVIAKMDDGTSRNMGTMKFSVRNIPAPDVQFGTLRNAMYADTSSIRNMYRLFAIPGSDFTFEGIKYTVTGFTFGVILNNSYKSVDCKGDTLSMDAIELLNSLQPGDRILIDKIKCVGPGLASDAELAPVVVTVK